MKALLRRMLDPNEFLSDYGVRSVSRYHLEHPYIFWAHGEALSVDYEPSEFVRGYLGATQTGVAPYGFR